MAQPAAGRTGFVPEVESLRGIAALVVVFFHRFETRAVDPHTFDAPNFDQLANFVLTTIFNGTGAVMLFFVISGFVLGYNISPDSTLTAKFYAKFAIRRIFRIMPALWVAVAIGAVLLVFYYHQQVHPRELLNAAILRDQALRFDRPLWSLQIEMAVSAVYPLLLFANLRLGIAAQVAVLAILSLLTYSNNDPVLWSNYLFSFQLGIMVPSAGRSLIAALGPRLALPATLVALIGIMLPTNLAHLGYLNSTEHSLIEGYSAFMILSYVLFAKCEPLTSFLCSRPVRFLGTISYSLYLLHLLIMDLVANTVLRFTPSFDFLSWGTVFALGMLTITLPADLLAAWISYKVVEVPFHKLGRRLAASIGQDAYAPALAKDKSAIAPAFTTVTELEPSA